MASQREKKGQEKENNRTEVQKYKEVKPKAEITMTGKFISTGQSCPDPATAIKIPNSILLMFRKQLETLIILLQC